MSTTRTCPSCGTPASVDERFCANCGTRLPETPPAVAPTVPLGGQGGLTPPPQAPLRLPDDMPAAAPKRKGLPIWAVILLGLAGLCAIGCVAAFFFLNVLGERVIEVAGTAVVEGRPTAGAGAGGVAAGANAQLRTAQAATAAAADPAPDQAPTAADPAPDQAPTADVILALPTDAPSQGGAGGVLGGSAPSAADLVQTAQAATAVAGAAAEVEALFAQASVVFQDDFVDNRNAWFVGVFEEIETDVIEDGVFKVIWAGKGTSYELYEVRELTSFITEVDCLVYKGGSDGSCGLIFAEQEDGYYKFELFDDYFRLFLVQADAEPTLLVEGDPSGAVRPGEPNRLRVIRQGDDIALFVNGAPLATASDLTFLTGKVGVSTNSYLEAGGVEVWFDNFVVWELP